MFNTASPCFLKQYFLLTCFGENVNGQFVTSGGFNSNEILRGGNSDKLKLFVKRFPLTVLKISHANNHLVFLIFKFVSVEMAALQSK